MVVGTHPHPHNLLVIKAICYTRQIWEIVPTQPYWRVSCANLPSLLCGILKFFETNSTRFLCNNVGIAIIAV